MAGRLESRPVEGEASPEDDRDRQPQGDPLPVVELEPRHHRDQDDNKVNCKDSHHKTAQMILDVHKNEITAEVQGLETSAI